MTSTFRGFSYGRVIAGCFSLVWLLLPAGCSPEPGASDDRRGRLAQPLPPRTDGEFASIPVSSPTAGHPPRSMNPSAVPAGLIAEVVVEDLPAGIQESARLFVFVRLPGERMPLGVQQYALHELPETVRFMGQAPVAEVELVARLSLSGRVTASPEDLEVVVATSMAHPPTQRAIKVA